MRIVLQRVLNASVDIENTTFSSIQKGIVLLVGIDKNDNEETFKYMFEKVVNLRIFEDENEKLNLSLLDLDLELMIIPNFTIYGDARKGRRPSFISGASPTEAECIFENFIKYAKERYAKVETGKFKADMKVHLVNDGPITILLDSDKLF